MDIKVVVAAHKEYKMPSDSMYLPVQVGASGKESIGYQRDDEGENISFKNDTYCELTGMYWAWKNLKADYIGLVHYRRYFTNRTKGYVKRYGEYESLLTSEEASEILSQNDCIVPNKRKYYIETLYSHYAHTLNESHLDLARTIIALKCPEYLPYVDKAYNQKWGYMFNMLIARRDIYDKYCQWLFDILEEMEEKIDVSTLTKFEKRVFGRVSEILFNVWILYEMDINNLKIHEVRHLHMEPINWISKGGSFLKAKFFGKKYNESF